MRRLLSLCAALGALAIPYSGLAQQPTVPLLQPGAPGQPTATLTHPTVGTAVKEPTPADVGFMQGMVMHHSQAVEMVGLMQTRTANPLLLELGQRIGISQGDEILFMKRWLTFHEKPLTENSMAGMDHAHMDRSMPMDMSMPTMPGMLTPPQMTALRQARGTTFDRLFLSGMIQHHTGALTMVNELFTTPSAGQDAQLFDFITDVEVTQQGEIDTMRNMLAKKQEKQ